jgi:hypothetical protein
VAARPVGVVCKTCHGLSKVPARERRAPLAAGRAIITPLVARFPDPIRLKQDLAWFDLQIATLKK